MGLCGCILRHSPSLSYAKATEEESSISKLSAAPLLGSELAADWADEARTRHLAERVAAQIHAAETAALLNRPTESVRLARAAVASDPLNERAWTVLVTAYELAGLPAEGLSAYARCRPIFDRDLGCAPGPALQAAHLRLLRQRAEADVELSEVMAALLYLGETLSGRRQPSRFAAGAGLTREHAGRIVDSFLQRARAAV